MAFTTQAEAPPLREDAAGALRIGDSRVVLELVIRGFQDGATPETIVQRYSSVALPDVYAVIAYYLRHRSEVEGYLARREQVAEEARQRIESHHGDLSEIRLGCSPKDKHKDEACCGCWRTRTSPATSYAASCLREPDLDIVRVQDVGLSGADDPDILAWAAENNRIILTHDRATMSDHAWERVAAGEGMSGLFILNDPFPVGQAIQEILLMVACSNQADWKDRAVHLPL